MFIIIVVMWMIVEDVMQLEINLGTQNAMH